MYIQRHGQGTDSLCSRSRNNFSGKPHRGLGHLELLLQISNYSAVITSGCILMATVPCSHSLLYFHALQRLAMESPTQTKHRPSAGELFDALDQRSELEDWPWKCALEVQPKKLKPGLPVTEHRLSRSTPEQVRMNMTIAMGRVQIQADALLYGGCKR